MGIISKRVKILYILKITIDGTQKILERELCSSVVKFEGTRIAYSICFTQYQQSFTIGPIDPIGGSG